MTTTDLNKFTPNQLRSLAALIDNCNAHGIDLDYVMERGYNENSGYVYIACEDGFSVAIFEGRTEFDQICYYVWDEDEEKEFDTYSEVLEYFALN